MLHASRIIKWRQRPEIETGTHAFRTVYNQLLEPGQLVNAFIDPA